MKFSKKCTQLLAAAVFSGISATAGAAAILFGQVSSGIYTTDGNQLAQMLTNGGHTVTNINLNTTVVDDYSIYDQVWVYDLFTGPDNTTNQTTNYTNISNWYLGLTDQNLIADGRIISSAPFWTGANGMSAEDAWIRNYATQLDIRGGGLVLGTDHATPGLSSGVFVDGINEINALIGIDPFSDFFGTYPSSQALVDVNSDLFVAGLDPCRDSPGDPCINDNSTTSFAPSGLQGNGQFLTPGAYHGTASQAFDQAAVSSTFISSTFDPCEVAPESEACKGVSVPEPSIMALFAAGLFGLGFARRRMRS